MIRPPSFAKNAIPTTRGWVRPDTNEILRAGSIAQKDIDEYLGLDTVKVEETVEEVEENVMIDNSIVIEVEDEAEWEYEEIDLHSMTKAELLETSTEWGIEKDEVNSTMKKSEIIEILEQYLD